MKRVIITYESKYGNTKRVAETIAEGMREARGVEITLSRVKEVDFDKIPEYDAILIGSPNHMGGPVGSVKRFIDKLGKLNLKGKQFAVFDTYIGKDYEKAVGKMEKRIRDKIPEAELIVSGLSGRVKGMKGPILAEELSRCKDFGRKVGAQTSTS